MLSIEACRPAVGAFKTRALPVHDTTPEQGSLKPNGFNKELKMPIQQSRSAQTVDPFHAAIDPADGDHRDQSDKCELPQ